MAINIIFWLLSTLLILGIKNSQSAPEPFFGFDSSATSNEGKKHWSFDDIKEFLNPVTSSSTSLEDLKGILTPVLADFRKKREADSAEEGKKHWSLDDIKQFWNPVTSWSTSLEDPKGIWTPVLADFRKKREADSAEEGKKHWSLDDIKQFWNPVTSWSTSLEDSKGIWTPVLNDFRKKREADSAKEEGKSEAPQSEESSTTSSPRNESEPEDLIKPVTNVINTASNIFEKLLSILDLLENVMVLTRRNKREIYGFPRPNSKSISIQGAGNVLRTYAKGKLLEVKNKIVETVTKARDYLDNRLQLIADLVNFSLHLLRSGSDNLEKRVRRSPQAILETVQSTVGSILNKSKEAIEDYAQGTANVLNTLWQLSVGRRKRSSESEDSILQQDNFQKGVKHGTALRRKRKSKRHQKLFEIITPKGRERRNAYPDPPRNLNGIFSGSSNAIVSAQGNNSET